MKRLAEPDIKELLKIKNRCSQSPCIPQALTFLDLSRYKN